MHSVFIVLTGRHTKITSKIMWIPEWVSTKVHILTRCSQQKCPSFSNFAGNSHAQKPNKAPTKRVNITYITFARVNRWCQLHILSFILSSFYFLTICANFPFCIRLRHLRSKPHPPAQVGIRKINTASPPTFHKSLAAAKHLHQSPRFLYTHLVLHLSPLPTNKSLPPNFGYPLLPPPFMIIINRCLSI